MPTPVAHLARRTVCRPVGFDGVGLFSPLHTRITVLPAPSGAGIVFHRTDLPGQPSIPAKVGHVATAPRKTVLVAKPGDASAGGAGVHTVEHLLSAMAGLGITDAYVEVAGAEIPMMDGSSAPFATALRDAGVGPAAVNGTGHHPVEPIVVTKTVRVDKGSAWAEVQPLPAGGRPRMEAEYRLDYGAGAPIAPQSAAFTLFYDEPEVAGYMRDVAPARTFATLAEALQMRQAGLFSHLREGDTLVIGPEGPVGGPYRLPDEPARHKLLDLIGDLSLAGRPIIAKVVASQSGHALNHELAAALLGQY